MFFKVITIVAITVAIFVLAAQTPNPRGKGDGIAIPLTRRSDTNARKFHDTSHNAEIIHGPSGVDSSDRNEGTPHPSAVKRDGHAAGHYLIGYMGMMWCGTISIGTPPKSFNVQLDTAFSDIIVPSITGDENCRSHFNLWKPPIIDLTLNTAPTWPDITNVDLNMRFGIEFADGRIAGGNQYRDNVTIAGITADIQTFGVATTYSSNMGAFLFRPDGVLGLAFPSISLLHGKSPLFHTLFNEGKLSQPVFSLMLTSDGGELYVGGMNEALYIHSTLVFTPVINPALGLWQLNIDNIKVNKVIILTDVPAVIDTGSNFIYGDSSRVLALHQAYGGQEYGDGYYTFPCNSFPSMTFSIGGKPFLIPAYILNKGRVESGSRDCFSGVVSLARNNIHIWNIGTNFLQRFYSVFDFGSDPPRVGFAKLSRTALTQ